MFLFYVLSFFKKGDTIQGGDIIQGWTLFKEIRYEVAVSLNKFVQYSTVVCFFPISIFDRHQLFMSARAMAAKL